MSRKCVTILALVHSALVISNLPCLAIAGPSSTTPKPPVGGSSDGGGSQTTKPQPKQPSKQAAASPPITVTTPVTSPSSTTLVAVSAAMKSQHNSTTNTFQSQQPFLIVSPTTTAGRLSPAPVNETFQIFLNPPSINELRVNSNQTVIFNCTTISGRSLTSRQYDNNNNANATSSNTGLTPPSPHGRHAASVQYGNVSTPTTTVTKDHVTPPTSRTYLVVIKTSDGKVAKLYKWDKNKRRTNLYDNSDYHHDKLFMHVRLNEEYNFTIEAMHIGYVTMSVTLLDTNSEQSAREGVYKALSHAKLTMATVRTEKTADFVFDCSAAAVAILISFGIGCVTDTESLKRQLKYPVSILIGICCQFLLMPVVSDRHGDKFSI